MLDNLTQRLSKVVKTLRGQARLTEENIQEALREVRMALLDPAAWRKRNAPATDDPQRLARGYEHYLMRQRQLAAVLEAHGIPVTHAHCPDDQDLCAHLNT